MSVGRERAHDPIVFSGPSGVGKTYMVKHLAEHYEAERLMATTTRGMRPSEVNMVDSHFLTEEEFSRQESAGKLFLASGHLSARYAFEHEILDGITDRGNTPLVEIYTPTVANVLGVMTTARTVFFRPPSIDYLRDQMVGRGQSSEDVAYRLQKAEEEIAYFDDEANQYYEEVYTLDRGNFGAVVIDIAQRFDLTPRN